MAGQESKVSGVVQLEGAPVQRTVRAYSYDSVTHTIGGGPVNQSKSLGHSTSDPQTGEYTIDLLAGYDKRIFVVAFDDYGADFTPDLAVAVGERIHPTTPNGHVWECTSVGTLPSEEPNWIVDTETAQLYGTASMIAVPFYRPMVHGPVMPQIVEATAPRFWRLLFTEPTVKWGTYGPNLQMSELSFNQAADNAFTPFTSVTDPAQLERLPNLYDGITAVDANFFSIPGDSVGDWVGYEFASPVTVDSVTITARAHPNIPSYWSPRGFIVQSSVDGDTWLDEWEVSGQGAWSNNETRTFYRPLQ